MTTLSSFAWPSWTDVVQTISPRQASKVGLGLIAAVAAINASRCLYNIHASNQERFKRKQQVVEENKLVDEDKRAVGMKNRAPLSINLKTENVKLWIALGVGALSILGLSALNTQVIS